MRCFYCNKELNTDKEHVEGWHYKCIKDFFGTKEIPQIDIEPSMLESLAKDSVNKGLTVPGVQKKLSLHLSIEDKKPRFTLVNYPTEYILKPESEEFAELPEAEHLAMTLAKMTGIATIPFSLIKMGDNYAYITKRIDRDGESKKAMEDFCQLSLRSTADKYKGSYEECGKIIERYSMRTGLDLSEIFLRLVFCHVIGNSDMHLKNFSLIETEALNRNFVLSSAYDLLPVNVIMPADKDFTALTLNGKKHNQKRNDYLKLADNIGLNKKVAVRIIEKVLSNKEKYFEQIDESYVSDEFKKKLKNLMETRMELLR